MKTAVSANYFLIRRQLAYQINLRYAPCREGGKGEYVGRKMCNIQFDPHSKHFFHVINLICYVVKQTHTKQFTFNSYEHEWSAVQ